MSEKRTVLVTGANKGIGLEISRQLTAKGMRVFMAVRNRAAGNEAAAGIPGAEVITLDVSQAASVQAAVAELASRVDRLDVLVNNAGILLDDSTGVLELTADTLWQTLETNLAGPLRLTQTCLPLLRKSHAPRVINMSSTAGQLAGGLQDWAPAYSISKTALNSLTQHLRQHYRRSPSTQSRPGGCERRWAEMRRRSQWRRAQIRLYGSQLRRGRALPVSSSESAKKSRGSASGSKRGFGKREPFAPTL